MFSRNYRVEQCFQFLACGTFFKPVFYAGGTIQQLDTPVVCSCNNFTGVQLATSPIANYVGL